MLLIADLYRWSWGRWKVSESALHCYSKCWPVFDGWAASSLATVTAFLFIYKTFCIYNISNWEIYICINVKPKPTSKWKKYINAWIFKMQLVFDSVFQAIVWARSGLQVWRKTEKEKQLSKCVFLLQCSQNTVLCHNQTQTIFITQSAKHAETKYHPLVHE